MLRKLTCYVIRAGRGVSHILEARRRVPIEIGDSLQWTLIVSFSGGEQNHGKV